MAQNFTTIAEFLDHPFDELIDVRSPAEFAEDHIPGAISLPALSNTERAEVGTIYVQDSPFRARKIGAARVARNVAAHLDGPLADKDGGWQPLVACWRGGQRSGSVASIFQQIGWRADTVAGGYQSWRRLVVQALYRDEWPTRVVLLDGFTGTAKTDVLARMAARGAQTLDLEGLANHRGSVFGNVGTQPSQKAFESAIASALPQFDPTSPVVVEAESSKVGERIVPPSLWKAMRAAPRLRIEAPVPARAAYLTQAYADIIADKDMLAQSLDALIRLQGRDVVSGWNKLVAEGAFEQLAAELVTTHYDPRYTRSRGEQSADVVLETTALDDRALDDLAARACKAISAL